VVGAIMYLDELTTFKLKERLKKHNDTIVILPIGAVEEHGEHLPLNTDSIQPEYIAEQVASEIDALIAPPIRYGICDTTRNFSGTISLSFNTFQAFIQEILEELCRTGINNIVILSGHAGRLHMAALRVAAEGVLKSYPKLKIMVLSDYDIIYKYQGEEFSDWDGHAGSVETSRILALRPELVTGSGETFKAEFPQYRILPNPEKYFPNGVMGDPSKASSDSGRKWNELVISELKMLIQQMLEDED
jgi:creatinine amidohydrolase